MKRDVAKQAANEMALKDVNKFFFGQRISLPVVTICGEEVEIDILARSGFWPGDVCAPRIVERRAQLFNQNWKSWRRQEDYTRSTLKHAQ